MTSRGSPVCGHSVDVTAVVAPGNTRMQVLIWYRQRTTGLTLTQSWNTANALESKLELNDSLAQGLKAEGVFSFLPASSARGAKFNLYFKQPNFHGRAFFDLLKGPTANIDAVVGHEGFLAGASAGYDVAKGAVTSYSAAVGYAAPTYSAAVTASDQLSLFAASYYHKVNSQVEAGAKATWNSKASNTVGLEVASKYRLDPLSFVKVCPPETREAKYNQCVFLKILTICTITGQDQRPRCCRRCVQRLPPPRRLLRYRRFLRYPEARPGQPQGAFHTLFTL